jgi:hypothetical protein
MPRNPPSTNFTIHHSPPSYHSMLYYQGKVDLCQCLTKHHTMKTYWGGGIAPCILDLGTRRRWMVSFTPRPLYRRGKSPPPRYPLDRRLDGLQSRSGCGGEEKNFQPTPGIKPPNPDRPAGSQTTLNIWLSNRRIFQCARRIVLHISIPFPVLIRSFTFCLLCFDTFIYPFPC